MVNDVPLLGFEGEYYPSNRKHVLAIPLPSNFIPDVTGTWNWSGSRIEVYGWDMRFPNDGNEGYNVFLPGQPPVSARSPLDVKMIIHDYLQR